MNNYEMYYNVYSYYENKVRFSNCYIFSESRCEDMNGRLELPILNELPRNSSRPLEVPYLSLFPAENVYESAAKLLFIAIKWARTIPSFLQVSWLFIKQSLQ